MSIDFLLLFVYNKLHFELICNLYHGGISISGIICDSFSASEAGIPIHLIFAVGSEQFLRLSAPGNCERFVNYHY